MTRRQEIRGLGLNLMREESALLRKVAMQTATEEELDRYVKVHRIVDRIEQRLYLKGDSLYPDGGDGARLVPTPMG